MNSVGPVMASYKASGATGVKSEVRTRAVNTAVCATKSLANQSILKNKLKNMLERVYWDHIVNFCITFQ